MVLPEVPVQPLPPPIRNGPTSSATEIKNSPCRCGDDSQCASRVESNMELPEDILHHIHAFMPMKDVARVACASRCFLRSWRFYPNLNLNVDTLGIDTDAPSEDEITRDFVSRVDPIMLNHAGTGVKMFKLATYPCSSLHPSYVDRWLQIAVAPGIKEFALQIDRDSKMDYDFPCSLLSSERASSIQSIFLGGCSFHPVIQIGQMSSLTSLRLRSVNITQEELCCFLSNSCALQRLILSDCHNIVVLKISHLLELNYLQVSGCKLLEVIDSSAPKLSTFIYAGPPIQISLGDALHVREMQMICHNKPDMLHYGSKKLPTVAPNLQKLYLSTRNETVNTPKAPGKFLQLKCLEILLLTPDLSPGYDFCCLVSFLDASPALETFILRIEVPAIRHDSILEDLYGDSLHPKCVSEYRHDNLKNMMITGFCSAKSMIDLTNHILEKAPSLEYLTLDTTRGYDRRYDKIDKCLSMSKEALLEAEKARHAIRIYVEGRVPSSVKGY